MSIAFKCPNCQQAYTVKDDLAGKRVVCKACKKQIKVPAPVAASSAPAPEVESLAVAALAEEPAAAAAEAPVTFTAECPNCMEQVQFDVKLAGKQSPCPNCRRIIRVPVPTTGTPKDWRAADHRPQFVKHRPDAALEGAWGNTTHIDIVDRESLLEAGAIQKRRRRELTPEQKAKRWALLGVTALVAFGVVWFAMGRRAAVQRDDSVQRALALLKEPKGSKAIPAGVRAEAFRGTAEYRLRQPGANAEDAHRLLLEAFGSVREMDASTDLERALLLGEIVLTEAELPGKASQVKADERLPWVKVLPDMRRTLKEMNAAPAQREGVMLTLHRLAQKLGLDGDPNQPALPALANNSDIFAGDDRSEALATVALVLLSKGDEERKKAEELANQVKSLAAGKPTVAGRVVALFVALKQPQSVPSVREPVANAEPLLAARLGYAEGYARLGEIDKARAVASLRGRFEDRFQALVAVAAVANESASSPQDLVAAVELLERELGNRDLPDWPLIRLAQLCARAADPGPGQRLNDFLQKLPANLPPRAQAVRAWSQMELLRSPGATVTDAAVKAIVPPAALGHQLAWEVLARRTKPATLDDYPEQVRAVGYVGKALGLLDR